MVKNRKKNEILLKISEYKLYYEPVPQSKNRNNFFAPYGDPPKGFDPKKLQKMAKNSIFYCILENMKNPRKIFFEDPFFKKVARK